MRFVETIVKTRFNKRNNNRTIMIKLGGLVDLRPQWLGEAEVFTATSKETGTTSVFKSKAQEMNYRKRNSRKKKKMIRMVQ